MVILNFLFFLGGHCFYSVPCDVLFCDQILKKNLSNDQRTSKNHVIRHRAHKNDEKKPLLICCTCWFSIIQNLVRWG